MKSITATITLIYLFFNLGFGMNQHYCMGFLKDVSFGHEKHECCCGESEMMENCCEDKHFKLSIEDDQIQNLSINIAPVFDLESNILEEIMREDIPDKSYQNLFLIKPPPKKSNSRIFIGSLTFYA